MHSQNNKLLIKELFGIVSGRGRTKKPVLRRRYQPQESARVRLFGQHGQPSVMVVQTGRASEDSTLKVNVGGGSLADVLGSMLGAVRNEGIGIAETENTRNLKKRNSIFSKAYYREFVIPGGKPLQLENAFSGMACAATNFSAVQFIFRQRSGASHAVSFIPQAGKDYEVSTYKNGESCTVMVYEIQGRRGGTRLVPVPVDY